MSNNYVLDINLNISDTTTDSAEDTVKDKVSSATDSAESKASKMTSDAKKLKLGVKALAISGLKYHLSTVYTRQGDTYRQQQVDYAMGVGLKAVGVGTAFAFGGPIAGGLAIATWGLDVIKRVDTYNYEAKIDDIGLEQSRRRAGASINRSRGGANLY